MCRGQLITNSAAVDYATYGVQFLPQTPVGKSFFFLIWNSLFCLSKVYRLLYKIVYNLFGLKKKFINSKLQYQ